MSAQTYEIRGSFTAEPEQAARFKETLEAAAAVFFAPTEENASALFTLGAEAVVAVAQEARASEGPSA